MKIKILHAFVIEGNLYEIMGEDAMIVTFACSVGCLLEDGVTRLVHKMFHVPGHVYNAQEGFNYCNRSRDIAQQYVDKVNDKGEIDPQYWEQSYSDGHVSYKDQLHIQVRRTGRNQLCEVA